MGGSWGGKWGSWGSLGGLKGDLRGLGGSWNLGVVEVLLSSGEVGVSVQVGGVLGGELGVWGGWGC